MPGAGVRDPLSTASGVAAAGSVDRSTAARTAAAAANHRCSVAQCTNMGCHRPPAPSENLDLTAGNGHGELVDVASEQCAQRLLVSPGKPGDSDLLDKLLGQSLCFGSQMPKASPLPAADIQAVADWICTGAAP